MNDVNRRTFFGAAAAAMAVAQTRFLADAQGAMAPDAIRPFRVNVPEATIAEMRRRIGDLGSFGFKSLR